MRLRNFIPILLACSWLAGCTSSSSVDALELMPSQADKTSSIGKPAGPVPPADIASVIESEASIKPPTPRTPVKKRGGIAAPIVDVISLVTPGPVSAAAMAIDEAVQRRRFRDAKPINFGSFAPTKLAVHGVDVSRWQGRIDWATLRAQGANFVYIKATDGGDHLDPMFMRNWVDAQDAGLRRGAYHFFYWCRTAGEQADWFIRNVPRVDGALPPVIDVEYNGESSCKHRLSPERTREKMQVFMDQLEAHYGQRPIIYTAPDFYRDNLKGEFLDYPFWLRAVAQHPSKVYPGRKWLFWQYSGSGLSQGVSGKIDLNAFYGSERDWRTWLGGQGRIARN